MKEQARVALYSLFIWGLSACSAGPAPIQENTPEPAASPPPNIVLVLFEDMSPRVGSFGDPLAHTPNFDRIAAEGVRYTRVFTTSGVCAPSRAALMTGAYQHTIGAQHMRTTGPSGLSGGGPQPYLAVPGADVKAFPERLRAAGYHTSNDSKTDYQFGEPFTIWDISGADADWSGRRDGQPFFHMRSLFNTHESAIWPIDMDPQNDTEAYLIARNRRAFADRVARTDPAEVDVPPYLPDTPEVRRDIATHYDNIAFTDAALGQIYDRLAREGLLDETILIVSTDHGDGLPRMKRSVYDSGLHVPMVIRYPDGHDAGRINDELISFVDLAPTILSWAGIERSDSLHGMDFHGADRDAARTYIFAAQDRMDNDPNRRRAVRDQRFKLIQNFVPGDPYFIPIEFRGAQPTMKALWHGHAAGTLPPAAEALFAPLPELQLYDTVSDPHEVNNLVGLPEYATDQARLRAALDTWMTRFGDQSSVSEQDMILDMWPEGYQPDTAPVAITVEPIEDGVRVTLASATPGASIGYRLSEPDSEWQFYIAPFTVAEDTRLVAKAIRYGFRESEETVYEPPA